MDVPSEGVARALHQDQPPAGLPVPVRPAHHPPAAQKRPHRAAPGDRSVCGHARPSLRSWEACGRLKRGRVHPRLIQLLHPTSRALNSSPIASPRLEPWCSVLGVPCWSPGALSWGSPAGALVLCPGGPLLEPSRCSVLGVPCCPPLTQRCSVLAEGLCVWQLHKPFFILSFLVAAWEMLFSSAILWFLLISLPGDPQPRMAHLTPCLHLIVHFRNFVYLSRDVNQDRSKE